MSLQLLETAQERGAASAALASLVYSSDTDTGLIRRRAGKGFYYTDGTGERIIAPEVLARIRELAIPPAWTDVWISPDPRGHLQATGRDDRGRKQYRYHPDWIEQRDQAKYATLVSFGEALPEIRQQVDKDLRKHGLTNVRVMASIVWLLDNALIRIGNATYARDNKNYGLTTLRDRHVKVTGSKLRFAFRGKSGKEWKLEISDRRIAKTVKGVQELPGQHLFQYLDEDAGRHAVTSQDVNRYIADVAGDEFSSKHFRTWGGTIAASQLLLETALPSNQREVAIALNRVIDQVAGRLGNTRAVCRKCYVHPELVTAWNDGRLSREFHTISQRAKPINGLVQEETILLHWLRRLNRS